jgi:hypothetical protein
MNDGHSLLRQAPAWIPEIGKKSKFDMPCNIVTLTIFP